MASKTVTPGLPQGFKPPFPIIQQATPHEDGIMACLGMLTRTSLDEVWKLAISQNWLPATGVGWTASEQVVTSLLQRLGGLRGSAWKDFVSYDAMPAVAVLWVDPHKSDPENTGRAVIFHHVAGVKDQYPSFSYCIDPIEADPERQIVTDLKRYMPVSFITVSQGKAS